MMKNVLAILILMVATTASAQSGKATTIKKTFSRATSIEIEINASPEKVWSLISNAQVHQNWNSTVVSLTGEIAEGEKIQLKSTLDTNRTFKLKVKELIPNKKMVWGDAMGERVYTIAKTNGGVVFSMNEKIGGFMFPLFANKIPSFDASFEQIAADLKRAAEAG